MIDTKIRKTRPTDFPACIRLLRISDLRDTDGTFYKKEWLNPYLADGLFYTAMRGKSVIGFIMGEKLKLEGAMIWFIVVHPDCRNRGIGTRLMKRFETACKTKGVTWTILSAERKRKTLNFYRKNNFDCGNYTECMKEIGEQK